MCVCLSVSVCVCERDRLRERARARAQYPGGVEERVRTFVVWITSMAVENSVALVIPLYLEVSIFTFTIGIVSYLRLRAVPAVCLCATIINSPPVITISPLL